MVVFSEKLGVFLNKKYIVFVENSFYLQKNKKPTLDFVFAGKFFPEEKK